MRDDKIYQMRNMEARRLAMIYRQVVFVQTRVEAYEDVLDSTWNKFRSLLSTSWLKKKIDQRQLELLNEHDKMIQENAMKVEPGKNKTNLEIVGANGFSKLVFILGCLPLLGYLNA